MTAEHLLDPELKAVLATFPPLELSKDTLMTIRDGFAQLLDQVPPPADSSVLLTKRTIPGSPNSPLVSVLCYRPADFNGPLPAVLHIHGGGYILGQASQMDAENRALAQQLKCAVFSVDYRLAPDSPHPAPVEDCYAALAWLHRNAVDLQVDSTRIGVKGESAGGGLAAALALLARDRGEFPLAFQHLIYPMIDDRTGSPGEGELEPHRFVGDYVWTPASNQFGWAALLGAAPGSAEVSPYAAPARASNLAGLPPTFISVGALDLFLEEDLEYARRLARAGVPVELHVYPGAFHGFDRSPEARVALAANRDSRDALRKALHG